MDSEYNSTMSNQGGKRRHSRQKISNKSKSATSTKKAAKWIEKTIKMRKCAHYIPSEDNEDCQCGYQKEDHTEIDPLNQEETSSKSMAQWNFSQHTRTQPTNAFGNIEFVDVYQRDNIERKFVRVDIQTDMSKMLKLMHMWGMEQPNLLISVTGGAEDFIRNPMLQDSFQRGLMKAVHSLGAWIITGGTHTGVIKYVGEAVRSDRNLKPVIAIGIAPWGVIHNREYLECKKELFESARYHVKGKPNPNEMYLDPSHSHFFLVDDGTQHKFEIEIPFRAGLEKKISKMKTSKGDVPVVMLVVGGGRSTLNMVKSALQRDTHTVIVKGSGGVADILADAFRRNEKDKNDSKNNQIQDSKRNEMHMNLNAYAEKMKGICTEQDMDDTIQQIQDCLAKPSLLHIYEGDLGNQDLDAIMLEILQKTFKPEDMMFYAIKSNNADLVKLLLVKTVDLKTFLTKETLEKLYNDPVRTFKGVSSKEMEKDSVRTFMGLCCKEMEKVPIGIFKDVSSKEMKKEFKLKDVMHLVQHLLGDKYLMHYEGKKNKKVGDEPKKESDFEITSLDLFLWSVLNNKQDVAKLLWYHVEDKMAAALVAHALLSAMSCKIEDRELCAEIEENGSEFMTLAIQVAQECHEEDEKKTQDMLIRRMKQWGNTTCIEIAVNAHDKGFISQQVCLDLFDKIWMGGLRQKNRIKILLACMAFPPLIPLLAHFEEKEDDHQNSSNDESEIHGQEAICCFSSQRCKVNPASKHKSDGKLYIKENANQILTVLEKFQTFYTAPIIIFMHNVISFIAFLLLYSYVLISKLKSQISVEDIILMIWVASFFIGEVIQVTRRRETSIYRKLKLYVTDGWNVLDMLTILLFINGMAVLKINPQPLALESAEVILGIDLALFYLRILHIFHAQRQIGPKLVMIINMVSDLGYLAAIIGVVILAYAVSSYAILYPNTELTIDTLIGILKRPYWNIFGELMLEEIEGADNCSDNIALYGNGTVPRCPTQAGKYAVPVMMGIYMLMTNILLLSLLIATFSYSIEKVKQDTDLHCSLHRYNLICEYCTKPWLAHPFAFLVYLLQIMFFIYEKCYSLCMKSNSKCEKCQKKSEECQCHLLKRCLTRKGKNAFKRKFSESYIVELHEFEELIISKLNQNKEGDHTESKANTSDIRIKQLVSKVNDLQQAVTRNQDMPSPDQKKMTGPEPRSTNLEKRMKKMEKQMKSISTVLQKIDVSLRELKHGAKQTIPGPTGVDVEC
ncbi:hypothetical protein CHS0354_006523 [Potamilus streckersoni]|uniref:Uncharacterized protein n=1 Tax=Potamilus streckersoni TaxID=2493646 RepID=A0AAE0TDK4_9BIVA|nr:hypothetical protein CHS0354_006523 [Potamilus streckersoni]